MAFTLNYDEAIHLDAEDLAESGIGEAYERLLPKLREFILSPVEIQEASDNETPSYAVHCGDDEYVIHAPHSKAESENSWGLAAVALFSIINKQMKDTPYRFFALNGGNDLFGIFLTPAEAEAAQHSLADRSNWPYLPRREHPWYGQYH